MMLNHSCLKPLRSIVPNHVRSSNTGNPVCSCDTLLDTKRDTSTSARGRNAGTLCKISKRVAFTIPRIHSCSLLVRLGNPNKGIYYTNEYCTSGTVSCHYVQGSRARVNWVTSALWRRGVTYNVWVRFTTSPLVRNRSKTHLEFTNQSLMLAYWLSFEFFAKAPPPRRVERKIV